MGRILFFAALGLLGYWFFKCWQRKSDAEDEAIWPGRPPQQVKQSEEGQQMLPCKYCGTYSPLDGGVMLEGRFYCNLEHARLNGEKVS